MVGQACRQEITIADVSIPSTRLNILVRDIDLIMAFWIQPSSLERKPLDKATVIGTMGYRIRIIKQQVQNSKDLTGDQALRVSTEASPQRVLLMVRTTCQ